MGLYYTGELNEATQWLEEATEPALARGFWRITVSSLCHRSLIAGELGRGDEQKTLADRALGIARKHGLEEVEGELFAAVASALEASGRLDEALATLERGVFLSRRRRHPRARADLLIRQAALLHAMRRSSEAASVVEEARAVISSCPDPRLLADRLAKIDRLKAPAPRQDNTLSSRELVILRALTGPLSERDIGRELYLSQNTVHSHTRSIYRKLGVSSRSEALRNAKELGLI
jgi:LuxR family transcriptional regulator, maltose regulon positive regulatory protein